MLASDHKNKNNTLEIKINFVLFLISVFQCETNRKKISDQTKPKKINDKTKTIIDCPLK